MSFYVHAFASEECRKSIQWLGPRIKERRNQVDETDGKKEGWGMASLKRVKAGFSEMAHMAANDGTADTDCYVDIVVELVRKALKHFGYFCEVQDIFGQDLFCIILVKDLKPDPSLEGFCWMPTSLASALTGCNGYDCHGEHQEGRGYEAGTSAYGMTLPINIDQVADLVKQYGISQTYTESASKKVPYDIVITTCKAVTADNERVFLSRMKDVPPYDQLDLEDIPLPELDLTQVESVYTSSADAGGRIDTGEGRRHRALQQSVGRDDIDMGGGFR